MRLAESHRALVSLILIMILSEKSATFRDHALAVAEALAAQPVLLGELVERAAVLLRDPRRRRNIAACPRQQLIEIGPLELRYGASFGRLERLGGVVAAGARLRIAAARPEPDRIAVVQQELAQHQVLELAHIA